MHRSLTPTYNLVEKRKDELIEIILSCSEEERNYKPDDKSWNMIEVAEHCHNIEKGVLFILNRNLKTLTKSSGLKELVWSKILSLSLFLPIRYKAPKIQGILPEGNLNLEKIITEWDSTRKKLEEYLDHFPDEKLGFLVFKHPLAGKLNLKQTLRFLHEHTAHHHIQLHRLKKLYLKNNKVSLRA